MFTSRQLLHNSTLRVFWDSSFHPSLKRKQDIQDAGAHTSQCVDALKGLLEGKAWASVAAALEMVPAKAPKKRGKRDRTEAEGEEGAGPEEPIMMALRLPSQLLLGMVRVHYRLLEFLQQDAQHTLDLLGLAAEAAPPHKKAGRKRKARAQDEEADPARARCLEEREVDLHDMDITLPEFESLIEFPLQPPRLSSGQPSSSAAQVSGSVGLPLLQPTQPQLQEVPALKPRAGLHARPSAPEYMEGDEVFDESAEAELSELMGAPFGTVVPKGTPPMTPPPPPTQVLLPHTPGAPAQPRGPLLPPTRPVPPATTTTITTSSYEERAGPGERMEKSCHWHREQQRAAEITLPEGAQAPVTLPSYSTEGLPAFQAAVPAQSTSTVPAGPAAGAKKGAAYPEDLAPVRFEVAADEGDEATQRYLPGDEAYADTALMGGAESEGAQPIMRPWGPSAVLGKRGRQEGYESASTEEVEAVPGMAEAVEEARQAKQAEDAAAATAAAAAPAAAEEGKKKPGRPAAKKGPMGLSLQPVMTDASFEDELIVSKHDYREWLADRKPIMRKSEPLIEHTALRTPHVVPPAALPTLKQSVALTSVDSAVQTGRLIDLLTHPLPALHAIEMPQDMLPKDTKTKAHTKAEAASLVAGLSAWALTSDEKMSGAAGGVTIDKELSQLYRYAIQGPPSSLLVGHPASAPKKQARAKRQAKKEREEEQQDEEQLQQERAQEAEEISTAYLNKALQAEGASDELAARAGVQPQEFDDVGYQEPAAAVNDEYETMMESQAELELPEAKGAAEQQELRGPTALPHLKEVQLLAYQRLPHRTRAAAGMLLSAFQEQQGAQQPQHFTDLVLELDSVVTGRSRISAARWFTDVIALQGCGLLTLVQDETHAGALTMRPTSMLMCAITS